MADWRLIPVSALTEPLNPQRKETLMERMDELVADIQANGLLEPLVVRDLGTGEYRVIAGHRRSIAVTILGWKEVMCQVFAAGEGDEDSMMGAENYHRNQLNPAEEAVYYDRLLREQQIGTDGLAAKLHVPQSRIEDLLLILSGDPRVFEALRRKTINKAQAVEINKFRTEGYRLQALHQAEHEGLAAKAIYNWRMDVQRNGLEEKVEDAISQLQKQAAPIAEEPMQICVFDDHSVPLRLSRHYIICGDHWRLLIHALELKGIEDMLYKTGYFQAYRQLVAQAEEKMKLLELGAAPAEG